MIFSIESVGYAQDYVWAMHYVFDFTFQNDYTSRFELWNFMDFFADSSTVINLASGSDSLSLSRAAGLISLTANNRHYQIASEETY